MAQFSYKALAPGGRVVTGSLPAATEAEALAALRERRLSPLSLDVSGAAPQVHASWRRGVSRSDITHATEQLASLLRARLSLDRALHVIADQGATAPVRQLFGEIGGAVREGSPLADVLDRYPAHFNDLYRHTVRAGELGGALESALSRLAASLDEDEQLRSRLRNAMTYPAIMFTVMVGSVIVLLTFVLPRFSGVFQSLGGALPWPTRALVAISHALVTGWWAWLAGGGALVFGIWGLLHTPGGRIWRDRLVLRTPVFGTVARHLALARFSLTLGTLLSNGVKVVAALGAARQVTGNAVLAQSLEAVAGEVNAGSSLAAALGARPGIFPGLLVGMVGTGEQSGSLAEMLDNCGRYYAREANSRLQVLTTLLEPAIIILMGVLVGFVIMAMLLPIFEISTLVH